MISCSITPIILGDSPYIAQIEEYLPYVLDRCFTLGINNTIRKFNISAHIFVDPQIIPLTNSYPNIPTISYYQYGDLIQKPKELYDTYTYNPSSSTPIFNNNKLAWCGFTHDYAISYCIMKGYKDIILIGAADFTGSAHHTHSGQFIYSNTLKEQSKYFIENVCSKEANIYTCNPESYLDIPRISFESLLD